MKKNTQSEAQLKALWQDSVERSEPSLHVAIHLIYAHYLQGTLPEFTKWMCQYQVGFKMGATIEGGREVLPGEIGGLTREVSPPEWVC